MFFYKPFFKLIFIHFQPQVVNKSPPRPPPQSAKPKFRDEPNPSPVYAKPKAPPKPKRIKSNRNSTVLAQKENLRVPDEPEENIYDIGETSSMSVALLTSIQFTTTIKIFADRQIPAQMEALDPASHRLRKVSHNSFFLINRLQF